MTRTDPLIVDADDVDERLRTLQAENAYRLIEELRERREKLGLYQKDVAKRMHRDPSVVSNIERLGADPRWSSLRRYASALGVVIEYTVMDFEGMHLRGRVHVDAAPDVDQETAIRAMLAVGR
jgi:transcriptional regulator with XRE-family HTH domain